MCFGVLVLSCSILKSTAWRASSSCHPLAWESLPQACWVRLVHCMLYPLAGAHVGSLSRTLPISRWWSCRLKFTWDDTWQSNPVWFYLENACLFYWGSQVILDRAVSQNSTEPNLIAMLYSLWIYMPIDSFTMVWFNVNKHFALIQKLGEEKSKNADQHILILYS